jgi:hypothetical protein
LGELWAGRSCTEGLRRSTPKVKANTLASVCKSQKLQLERERERERERELACQNSRWGGWFWSRVLGGQLILFRQWALKDVMMSRNKKKKKLCIMRLVLDSFLAMNTYRRWVPNVVIAAALAASSPTKQIATRLFFLLPTIVTKTDDHDGWKTSIQTRFLVAAAAAAVGGWLELSPAWLSVMFLIRIYMFARVVCCSSWLTVVEEF